MAISGAKAGTGLSFLTLPEPEQMAIDAGINLFELRKVELSKGTPKDFGLWDVKVRLRMGQSSSDQSYNVEWLQGQRASITYRANSKGVCIGFCPDDDLWHNRILLSVYSEKNTKFDRYHTKNGVVSGANIRKELDILRDYIHDWILVDTDDEIEGRKVLFRSKIKAEVEEQYIQTVRKNLSIKARFNIEQAKIVTIEKLVEVYQSTWFAQPEFQEEIKPKIQEIIRETMNENLVNETAGNLLASVQTMTTEQREQLRDLLFPGMSVPTAPVVESPVSVSDQAASTAKVDINELRSQAAKLGIPHIGRKKAELIEDIRNALIKKSLENTAPSAPASTMQTSDDNGPVDEYPQHDLNDDEEAFK